MDVHTSVFAVVASNWLAWCVVQWPLSAVVTGSASVSLSGLTASTNYWLYFRAASGSAASLMGPLTPGVDRPFVS